MNVYVSIARLCVKCYYIPRYFGFKISQKYCLNVDLNCLCRILKLRISFSMISLITRAVSSWSVGRGFTSWRWKFISFIIPVKRIQTKLVTQVIWKCFMCHCFFCPCGLSAKVIVTNLVGCSCYILRSRSPHKPFELLQVMFPLNFLSLFNWAIALLLPKYNCTYIRGFSEQFKRSN